MEEVSTLQMIMPFLLVGAMLATAAVLGFGVLNLLRASKKSNAQVSNKLMQYRIVLQAAALVIFLILLALKN